MRKFFRGRMELVAALMFPLTIMLLFGVMMRRFIAETDLLGGADYIAYMTPGIIALTGLTASMLAGTALLNDRLRGVIQEYLVAPIPRASIAGALMASGVARGILQALVIFIVALLLQARPEGGLYGLAAAAAGFILFCAGFTGVAVGAAARAASMEGYHGMIMLFNVPLLFISNALYPIDVVPAGLRILAWANPATYAITAMRRAFLTDAAGSPALSLAVLAVFAAVGLAAGMRGLRMVTDV